MRPYRLAVATFVILGILLFGVTIFLIGDHNKVFQRHADFYTDLENVNGLRKGSQVRVSGFQAGQITGIEFPSEPGNKFRLKLHVDDKLHNLIRGDSVVTVETDGLVGDKFLLIHQGSLREAELATGATILSKEPIELSAIMEKVSGTVDQANATLGDVHLAINDVHGRLDRALDTVTATVQNTNGVVDAVRQGHGPIATLLNDQQVALDIKTAVASTRDATGNLDQVSRQAKQFMTDFQSRDLIGKADTTIISARDATQNLDQASQQLNSTLHDALEPDPSGQTIASNLRDTLSNVDTATANMADDTEALKHEFFFRGFFKKRGFYSLQDLTADQYRSSDFFRKNQQNRVWIDAQGAFAPHSDGAELLTVYGQRQIDQFIASRGGAAASSPLIIEGYSIASLPADQLIDSRRRAFLVKVYLEKHFHLSSKNIGVVALENTAPPSSGKSTWNGVSLVLLSNGTR